MKIAILADQHGELPPIPPCDLMILSGDITGGPDHVCGQWRPDLSDWKWREWLATDFARWVQGAPMTVAIAGNHDTAVQQFGFPVLNNLHYLRDSGCEVGGLKFWGTPWIKQWDDLAFNLNDRGRAIKLDMVPDGTDVLVCHMPPFGIGDLVGGKPAGCCFVLNAINRVKPRLVTCGHIHEGRGMYRWGETTIVNAARGFVEFIL